jgi:hypothetical protein
VSSARGAEQEGVVAGLVHHPGFVAREDEAVVVVRDGADPRAAGAADVEEVRVLPVRIFVRKIAA